MCVIFTAFDVIIDVDLLDVLLSIISSLQILSETHDINKLETLFTC